MNKIIENIIYAVIGTLLAFAVQLIFPEGISRLILAICIGVSVAVAHGIIQWWYKRKNTY